MANEIIPKEYIQILTKGLESSLATTPIEDGKVRYCYDTGRVYLDLKVSDKLTRIKVSDIEDSYTEEELAELLAPSATKVYIAKDTHRLYKYQNGEWYDLSGVLPQLAEVEDSYKSLWFGVTDDTTPLYDTDLSYNTAKKEMKVKNVSTETVSVGNMKITNTTNEDGSKTVEFSFV